MSALPELTAKSLSLDELASRLRDHDEPAIRIFAERVINALDRAEISEGQEGEE